MTIKRLQMTSLPVGKVRQLVIEMVLGKFVVKCDESAGFSFYL
jgi:hypothetical protein